MIISTYIISIPVAFPASQKFLPRVYFPFIWRTCFRVYFILGMLVKIFLNFPLSEDEDVSILSSILKNIYTVCITLCWPFFYFSTLKKFILSSGLCSSLLEISYNSNACFLICNVSIFIACFFLWFFFGFQQFDCYISGYVFLWVFPGWDLLSLSCHIYAFLPIWEDFHYSYFSISHSLGLLGPR